MAWPNDPIQETPKTYLGIHDWMLGMNDSILPSLLPKEACPLIENMYYKEGDSLTSRFGYTTYNASALGSSSGIRGLFPYYEKGGNRHLIIASGTLLWEGNSGTPAQLTGASGLSLTDNLEWDAAQVTNSLFMGNGTNPMVKVNVTTASTAGGSPPESGAFGILELHHNILFGSGLPVENNRVYFTAIGNGESWGALDFLSTNTDDGDVVTAMQSLGDALLMFKEGKIIALEGSSDSTFFQDTISEEYGCSGKKAVCLANINGEEVVFFYDGKNKRICVINKAMQITDITSDVVPTLMATVNQAAASKISCVFFDNKVIFNVPTSSSTDNNTRIVIDTRKRGFKGYGAILKWTGGFSSETVWYDGSSYTYYSGSPTLGTVFINNSGNNDGGTAITIKVETAHFASQNMFQSMRSRKMWLRGMLTGSNTELNVPCEIFVDGVSSDTTIFTFPAPVGTNWNAGTWGAFDWASSSNTPSSNKQSLSTKGATIGFKFENDTLDQPFTLYAIEFQTKIKRKRVG